MSKKVAEVGTFTILSKSPKGQKSNVVYTFEYQRTGSPEIFKVQMLWLDFRAGDETWAFMDGRDAEKLTLSERKEFISEIPKFQKGGSYRKTHPITYSKSGLIQQSIKHKEYELQVLRDELNNVLKDELSAKCDRYKKLIDNHKLDFLSKQLNKAFDKTGYTVKLKYIGHRYMVSVYDVNNSIPVGEITDVLNLDRNIERLIVAPLDDYDIKSVIKSNNNISNMLEE